VHVHVIVNLKSTVHKTIWLDKSNNVVPLKVQFRYKTKPKDMLLQSFPKVFMLSCQDDIIYTDVYYKNYLR